MSEINHAIDMIPIIN